MDILAIHINNKLRIILWVNDVSLISSHTAIVSAVYSTKLTLYHKVFDRPVNAGSFIPITKLQKQHEANYTISFRYRVDVQSWTKIVLVINYSLS